jgi:putative aldouronate transport system permease protein
MAIIVVATLPIMLLYPWLQKYFIKGMFIGSLKE